MLKKNIVLLTQLLLSDKWLLSKTDFRCENVWLTDQIWSIVLDLRHQRVYDQQDVSNNLKTAQSR